MKNAEYKGGAAFPTTEHQHTETGHYPVTRYGMDLRDYFAAKAMSALLSDPKYDNATGLAQDAYRTADAMLKAREQ